MIRIPETSDEFFITYVSISINIVVFQKCLKISFLWEQSITETLVLDLTRKQPELLQTHQCQASYFRFSPCV